MDNLLTQLVIWKAKLPPKLVKHADVWVKKVGRRNIYFIHATATTSLDQLVSTYPGPLMLVSILCSDPYLKRKHHKRRIVQKPQKPLVDSTVNNLIPSAQVYETVVFDIIVKCLAYSITWEF
ncbi:hypothetical protein M0R45_035233 [Rubus argutus]|uniref:tRNA (guanine(46)-N(7))-methyltransferase n=1 Tax=Rubus argutus TaxID=59490 RepID=A0AAW1VW75_RUBAR